MKYFNHEKGEINGVITARGGSKGIPGKNIKLLCGKPLLFYVTKAAIDSNCFEKIYLSTDSEEIANYGRQLGLEVAYLRPKELAEDSTKSIEVIFDLIKKLNLKGSIFLMQPTSPLINSYDIKNACEMHLQSGDSILSVRKSSYRAVNTCKLYESNKLNFVKENTGSPRQKNDKFYELNGAIFLNKIKKIFDSGTLAPQNSRALIMPNLRSIDIDDMEDWEMAELIIRNKYILKD